MGYFVNFIWDSDFLALIDYTSTCTYIYDMYTNIKWSNCLWHFNIIMIGTHINLKVGYRCTYSFDNTVELGYLEHWYLEYIWYGKVICKSRLLFNLDISNTLIHQSTCILTAPSSSRLQSLTVLCLEENNLSYKYD